VGLQISAKCHPVGQFESYGSWVEIPFTKFADPFSNCSAAMDIMLTKSQPQLKHYLQEMRYDRIADPGEPSKLFKMASRMGWVTGCETLLEAGMLYMPRLVEETPAQSSVSEPLLFDAIESRNPHMVLFWLHMRDKADADHLPYIGSLETSFVHASEICRNSEIADVILSNLIGQRKRLQELAEKFGITHMGLANDETILDTHAVCVAQALVERCVEIPPAVWPSGSSVYNVKQLYREQPPVLQKPGDVLRTFCMLYSSGFKQIAENKCPRCRETYCSLLVFAITSYRRFDPSPGSLPRFFEIVEWFLAHGASLIECWPNSRTTAVHCMASKAAMLTWSRPLDSFSRRSLATVLRYNLTDDCECNCSTSGCTAITSFWKGSYRFDVGYMAPISELSKKDSSRKVKPSRFRRIGRWELEHAVRCVEYAVTSVEHRWIITQFIRLLVFSLLGIRHTCCNLDRIEHLGEPDFSKKPLPRYPLDKVQRVRSEDEHLVAIMELNVTALDAWYDAHDGDLQSFVDLCLLPRMELVLNGLKEEH